MVLCESIIGYLEQEILTYYNDEEKFKAEIFVKYPTTVGIEVYTTIPGNDFKTRIINLINELIKTNKLEDFIKIIRVEYNLFAKDLPQKYLIQILNDNCDNNPEILLKAYQFSMPNRTSQVITNPKNPTELINGLMIPHEQTYSYIEKFVVYLVDLLKIGENTQSTFRESLIKWVQRYISPENHKTLKKQLREQENTIGQRKAYILFFLRTKGKKYALKAWLIKYDEYKKEYLEYRQLTIKNKQEILIKQEVVTNENLKNDLAKTISNFIHQAYNNFNSNEEIHLDGIKICLPYNLMHHAFDCYHYICQDNNNSLTTTIGEEYEVIIQCLERLEVKYDNSGGSHRKIKWINKWKIFQNKLEESAEQVFITAKTNNPNEPKDLLNQMLLDNVIGVKIINVFENDNYPGEILYTSGIPVALWIRKEFPNIEQELNELFTIDNKPILLRDLPNQLKHKRLKGQGIANDICLLWDDPNLQNPEQILTHSQL
jgi:hypothetical protein